MRHAGSEQQQANKARAPRAAAARRRSIERMHASFVSAGAVRVC